MLNKIKMMVVVLVCMVVVGSIASTVAAVDIASKEAAVAEVKAEIAKVDEEEAEIVEKLEAGYESDDIEASVKIVDLSSLYAFLYGMSVDYAVSEGIKDGDIVYCINHAGNSDFCRVVYDTEDNIVDFVTIEELKADINTAKFDIVQISIGIIAVAFLISFVLLSIIDDKFKK